MPGDLDDRLERVLVFSIETAGTNGDLAIWWRDNNHVIRRLPEPHKTRVIAAKDKRKRELTA